MKYFFAFIVILVLFSIGLHLFQIEHTHPAPMETEGGEGVINGSDRKFLMLLLVAVIFIFTSSLLKNMLLMPEIALRQMKQNRLSERIFALDMFRSVFSSGILHPKLCA